MGFSHSGGHWQQSSHWNTDPATHPRYQGVFTIQCLITFMVPCGGRFFTFLIILFQLLKPIPLEPRQSLRVKNCSVKWGTWMSALCAVFSSFFHFITSGCFCSTFAVCFPEVIRNALICPLSLEWHEDKKNNDSIFQTQAHWEYALQPISFVIRKNVQKHMFDSRFWVKLTLRYNFC